MIKKTITFLDLDENPIEETYYFNLSVSELTDWTAEDPNTDLQARMEEIGKSNDVAKILPAFKDIIRRSVGKRADNGRTMLKTDSIRDEFFSSGAFDELFMEFVTNPAQGAAFVNGIFPADLAKRVAGLQLPNPKKEYTREELLTIDEAEFRAFAGQDEKNWSRENLLIAMQRRNQAKAA